MIFDVNAWLGVWPFRTLRDNSPETLVARFDRSGITGAAVSLIEAVFHRYPQPANEKLAEMVAPFSDRLFPMATINPLYPGWERDLIHCHEKLGMVGVRIFPVYHDFDVMGSEATRLAEICAERGLPISIPQRMEDARQHHPFDPGEVVDLGDIADLIASVPTATIIIPNARQIVHCPLWTRKELRSLPWYIDLSLTEIHYALHKDVSHMREAAIMIEEGGADHFLFGSHVPISYAGAALVKLQLLPVDDETLKNISCRTAEKIFEVSLTP